MTILTDHLELPSSIGATLRRQRHSAGLTTAEVADAAGVSPRLLFLIENAQPVTTGSPEEVLAGLERICSVLEMDPVTTVGRAVPVVGDVVGPATSMIPRADLGAAGQADQPTLRGVCLPVDTFDVIPTATDRHRGRLAAGRRTPRRPQPRSARALRLATAAAALAVAATAVAVVLAGGPTLSLHPPKAAAASTRSVTRRAPARGSVVLGLTTTSPASATLAVGAAHYAFTVTAGAPCWVEIRSAGGSVLWAQTLSAGQQKTYTADQSTSVLVGAGSVKLVVSWGSHRYTLSPPMAPYTYSFRS